MNGANIIGNKPEPKVAVLRIPADAYNANPPQGRMLFIMQQLLAFMGSPFYQDFDGLSIQLIDPSDIRNCKVILQIGEKPDTGNNLIIPN